jgi:hypothetical protein
MKGRAGLLRLRSHYDEIKERGYCTDPLYRYLDRLRENALNCVTDTAIHIQPRGEPQLIETGDKLRDMTSELRPSQMISEFASGGPKNYAYRVLDTETEDSQTVCKVRGHIPSITTSRN